MKMTNHNHLYGLLVECWRVWGNVSGVKGVDEPLPPIFSPYTVGTRSLVSEGVAKLIPVFPLTPSDLVGDVICCNYW